MITYSDLFVVLKAGGKISAQPDSETRRLLDVLWERKIVKCDFDFSASAAVWRYSLHPHQVERMAAQAPVIVVDIPAKIAPASDLGKVRVDWSGRGHSSGAYRVVGDKGKFLEIAFDLDVTRKMTVAKTRTVAA